MKSERVLYFDVLNVVSCFSVVCLHSNGYVHEFIKDDYWWLRVLIEVLCFFAVPVFFMLTGATLMEYRNKYSTKVFIKKRFHRAFLPFLFWSIVFMLFQLLILIRSGNMSLSLKDALEAFVTGNIPYTNYWFFIPLFLLYVFLPFLSRIVGSLNLKSLLSLCGILFLFQFLIPTIYTLIGIDVTYNLPIGGFFVYALLGYYLSKTSWDENNSALYVVFFLAVLFLIIRYCLIYFPDEKLSIAFSYFGMYAFFPSIALFLLIKKLSRHTGKYVLYISWSFLAKKSYGVFLIHTFIISNLLRFIELKSVLFIPISIVSAYFGSVLIVHLMQSNRLMKYMVP